MKIRFIYILVFLLPVAIYSQDSYLEGFDDTTLSTEWNFQHDTYQGSVSESALLIDYNRSPESWIWDQFNIQFSNTLNIADNPYLSIKVRSDENINLVLKPENTSGGSDWLEEFIVGDGEWKEIFYELSNSSTLPIQTMYIYFDPGSTTEKMATVEIDYISIGGNITIPLNTALLEQAVIDASNLESNLVIGLEDGNNSQSDRDKLQTAIQQNEILLSSLDGSSSQSQVDSTAYALYDICTLVEQNTYFDTSMPTVDDSLTYSAKILLENLHKFKNPRFMYGMHDATGYGVNWSGDDDRSDVKDVTGSYPAFFSWDANGIVGNQSRDRFSYRMKSSHERGVVSSYCWHQYDPEGVSFYSDDIANSSQVGRSLLPGNANNEFYKNKLRTIANYAKSTRAANGRTIPIIFRPYHEHNGWWFWWGSNMPEQDYVELWKYTVDYLKNELNVHNFVYAFSPDGGQINALKPYDYRYPGDEYVDVLGLDFYFDSGTITEINRFIGHVESTVLLADSLNKVAAITEIGDRNALEINNWHTRVVLDPIKENEIASKIAYIATWRNANTEHHFAPYPGHKSELDFLDFYSDTTTVFLNNMVKGISDSLYTGKLNEKSDAAFIYRYKLNNGPQFTIQNNSIIYDGPLNFNYSNATATFDYSDLAIITIDNEYQVSDSSKVNLSIPTSYTVVSENGEVTRDYDIVINGLVSSTADIKSQEIVLDIFPLPARDFININTPELMKTINVKTINGSKIRVYDELNTKTYQIIDLTPGVHIIEVLFKNGKVSNKKIIVH